MRRILVLTGIRSEYYILRQVLKGITSHPNLELSVVVTGAHLSPLHGFTVESIKADGFNIEEEIVSLINSNALIGRTKGLGIQLLNLAQTVERIKPDIILVTGDREEGIAGALVGTYMNVPVAHMSGGDRVKGNVDDVVRHAITKLANLHFAFTENSAQRILKMGEEPWRVFCTGSPALDDIRVTPRIPLTELSKQLEFPLAKPFIVLLQHPLSSEYEEAGAQIKVTLEAITELKYKTVVIYPNSDAGSHSIIRVIDHFTNHYDYIRAYRTPSREAFVNLLRQADLLVGNSSCGIIEAPYLKLPAINVGVRQQQRLHAENMVFVSFDKKGIKETIIRIIEDEAFRKKLVSCSSPYGDGYATKRIVKVLAEIPLDKRLLVKEITY